MKKIIIIIAITCLFTINACSLDKDYTSKPAATEKKTSNVQIKKSAVSSSKPSSQANHPKVTAKTNDQEANQKLELDHIILYIEGSWKVIKGLDSASFQQNGKSIGGIDGLGYSESINALLPNQRKILNKKELSDSKIKAYSVILQRDSTDGNSSKEIHIVYLLPTQKSAYDLHFDLALVDEKQALIIAKSALQK